MPAMVAKKVAKLREQAYESFTDRLLSQAIRPGQFISQRELVEITGMTLGAIRELVPRLEADGLTLCTSTPHTIIVTRPASAPSRTTTS